MLNKKRFLLPIFGCLSLGVFTAAFSFVKVSVYGQDGAVSSVRNSQVATKPENSAAKEFDSKMRPIALSSGLRVAAEENARLKNNLAWTFGKKTQRGWYLYVPLIQHAIRTEAEPETPAFARAVALWQTTAGFAPSGRIDDETLFGLIEYWQSRRLNSSAYASEDRLFTAPIGSFYDPLREFRLLQVERETYAAYQRMLAAALADKSLNLKLDPKGGLAPEEKFLRVISAFRSREYQAELRRKSPHSGSAGLAVNSPHFTGRALDIYVGGEPVETKDANRAIQTQTPVYRWLVKNAARFGFYPYYYEPWHWEYVPENGL